MGWRSAPVRVPDVNGLVTRTETCRNATCRITSAIRTNLAYIDMCELVAEVAKGLLGLRYSLRRCIKAVHTAAKTFPLSAAPGTRKSLTVPRCVGTGSGPDPVTTQWDVMPAWNTDGPLYVRVRCLSLARARGGRGVDERAARACALLVAEVPDARANQTRNR